MQFTRRSLLRTSAAAAVTATAGAGLASFARPTLAHAAPLDPTRDGDVVGRITTGYQGWFAAEGDNSLIKHWWHWSTDRKSPRLGTNAAISWPDVTAYTHRYRTDMPALGDGRPAEVFSNHDAQSVDLHVQWMAQTGIHTAAVQRFDTTTGERPQRDAVLAHVKDAAERHGVKFFIMYDISGWKTMRTTLLQDWQERMQPYVASPAYARQDGKPVVAIWGFGFRDESRSQLGPQACQEVIDWFKSRGIYVIGGIPLTWRRGGEKGDGECAPGYHHVFRSFDMVTPWMVGRLHSAESADQRRDEFTESDVAECARLGIDYQGGVIPGDLQQGHRAHGETMWRQFYNHARTGVRSAYVAMFDEYNEGNQIAPTAATSADVPAGSGIRPLDEDGTACSPDFYLRLTGDGGRMLRGEIALTPTIPTPFKAGTPAPTAEPTTTATPEPTPSATSAAPTPAPTAAQPTASRPPAPPLPSATPAAPTATPAPSTTATPSAVPPLGARPGPDRGRWGHRWARRWRARHGRRGHRR